VGRGTGLGLSVSYGIVQEHGGRLGVASVPGETVFTLELPLTPPPAPASRSEPRVAGGIDKVALLVEDEAPVLDLIVALLGASGWRVDVASGARAAAERLHARRYDLIVADMRMPDGDAEELYRQAVALDADYRHRFVLITGDGATERGRAFLAGVSVPVVEKPFAPQAFQDAVSRVIAAAPSDPASAPSPRGRP
jgi:CheY-like chemotaxis protein